MISGIASVVAVLLSCLPLAGSEPIDETNGSVTDVAELVCDESFEPILLSGRVVFESGEPAVGSVVSIELRKRGSTERQTARIVTSDDGRFRARIRVEPEILVATPILAESADGQLAGMFGFASNRGIGRQERVEIRLANFRKLSVLVTDDSGAGIEGARVAVCTGLPFYTKAGSTNSDGVATIQVPANCRIEQVVAWSDAQGLDYRLLQPSPDENVAGNVPPADLFPTNQLTLKLEGAVPVSFKVVDQQGQPLVGAMVRPWLLRRDSASGFLNCSGFGSELTTLTDAQGTTEFPWFPAWQKQNVVVWPSHPGFVRKRVVFQPDDATGVQEIVLTRLVPIRGTVRYADGKPAKNIRLTADGDGFGLDQGMASCVSADDGTYELLVPPDQIYLVVATGTDETGEPLASTPQTGFAVLPETPVEGRDFTMKPATRVVGTLLSPEDKSPVPNTHVTVLQHGTALRDLPKVQIANPDGSTKMVVPVKAYHLVSDETGQFELFLSDGAYTLKPPGKGPDQKFRINGEQEFVIP